MSGIWKSNIGLSIFGESHGEAIGITLSSIRPGIELDYKFIQDELNRRRPGQNDIVTPRDEKDEFEILSGVFEGKTTGAPLTMIIRNTNARSEDYSNIKDRIRPGHADYTSKIKYDEFNDYRGGGHFSGRITAGLVFAGAIAKLILKKHNILIGSQITKIGNIKDDKLEHEVSRNDVLSLLEKPFPVINADKYNKMKQLILDARDEGDSVGGEVRCFGINVPAGLGDPFFDSFESTLAQLIFSIPSIKGLEFGSGFRLSEMSGSMANDEYYYKPDGSIATYSNHNGGIIGGITNGMTVDFTVAIKPTPSINKNQRTIDWSKNQEASLSINGRHDPCIVMRVVPVIESVLALTILDKMNF